MYVYHHGDDRHLDVVMVPARLMVTAIAMLITTLVGGGPRHHAGDRPYRPD
jgi:hypothetical protein